MIATIKKSDGFLIPNFDTGKGFLSIKNGKKFQVGIVVYTGVGLDGISITNKIEEFGEVNFPWIKNTELFDKYLQQVKNLKISKKYSLEIVEDDLKFDMQK